MSSKRLDLHFQIFLREQMMIKKSDKSDRDAYVKIPMELKIEF